MTAENLQMLLYLRDVDDVIVRVESPISLVIYDKETEEVLYRIYVRKKLYEEWRNYPEIRKLMYDYKFTMCHCEWIESSKPDPHDLLAQYDTLFKKEDSLSERLHRARTLPTLPDIDMYYSQQRAVADLKRFFGDDYNEENDYESSY